MTIQVDHESRRQDILRKTLRLIGERGYRDVTYAQIGDVCGLSRTTLYKYFRNKREIFDRAIFELVQSIGSRFETALSEQPGRSTVATIRLLCEKVLDTMAANPPLMQAITEYLINLRRCGEPVNRRLRRHTIGLHRLLTRLVRNGIASGELRAVDALTASETLYALLESATIRLTLVEEVDLQHYMGLIDLTISGWRQDL